MTWAGHRALSEARRTYAPSEAPAAPASASTSLSAKLQDSPAARPADAKPEPVDRDGPEIQPATTIDLKLADALLEPRAAQEVRGLAAGEAEGSPRARLVLPGAIGYVRYDEGERTAQAQVLIAGRFIASATVDNADDGQAAASALRALDILGLAQRALPQ